MASLLTPVLRLGENSVANVRRGVGSMTAHQWLRLIMLVCGYLVLRRILLIGAARRQATMLQEESALEAEQARITANERRDGRRFAPIPGDSDEDDENDEAAVTASDWGKKARRRQRRVLRTLVDLEESRLRAQFGEDDDKDIDEFLVQDGDDK